MFSLYFVDNVVEGELLFPQLTALTATEGDW